MKRKAAKKDPVEQVKECAAKEADKAVDDSRFTPDDLIPTGSTMLNLALSDTTFGGLRKGRISNTIGDSGAGKSLLTLTTFAEMSMHSRFDKYRFIRDDIEAADEFNLPKLIGAKAAGRVEAPRYDKDGKPKPSNTVKEFESNVLNAIEAGKPFIYVADSFDALTTDMEIDRAYDRLAALNKGKEFEGKGTYGTDKAKGASELLRLLCRSIENTESHLIVVSQTRQPIGLTFAQKTRSGGDALHFYCTHEYWLAKVETLKGAHDLKIGAQTRIRVSKNKLTGKQREIEIPIYYDYGIDDIGSCVGFMIDWKLWPKAGSSKKGDEDKKGAIYQATALGIEGTRKRLIDMIELDNLEDQLRAAVGQAWAGIEDSLKLGRKSRYA